MTKALENCHSILKKGLQLAAEVERPPPPYHLGGPRPVCPAVGQVRIAIWCAEALLPSLKASERATYRSVLALARKFVGARAPTPSADLGISMYPVLVTASTPLSRGESRALLAARNACGASASLARGKSDLVFTAAQAAFAKAVKFLGENPRGLAPGSPSGVRELLTWLDEEILCLEAAAAMTDRAGRPVSVERVLWRAGDEKQKKAVHFLGLLRGGAWGLVTKIGRNWSFVEGPRDAVVASVPDALFKEAMASAQARMAGESHRGLTI